MSEVSRVQEPEPKSVIEVAVRMQALAAALRSEAAIASRPGQLNRLEEIADDLTQLASWLTTSGVIDPTSRPDPRRWGTERRTGRQQRVYWDASLHARGENAWTNVERTERFTADVVIADPEVSRG